MKPAQNQAEALDAFVQAVIKSGPQASDDLPPVDAATARLVQDLRSLAETTAPRPGFVAELEAELLREAAALVSAPGAREGAVARPPVNRGPFRAGSRSWPARAAALALFILALGAGLGMSSAVRAQLQRAACLVPGLGIRACEAPGLVAAQPVSVAQDGATLIVTHLISSGGETTLRLEITGLPTPSPQDLPPAARLTVRDAKGKEYQPLLGGGYYGVFREGGGGVYRRESIFTALDPDVRDVEVLLDASPPVGRWAVRVPVVPVDQAGLLAAREGPPGMTLDGVTVRVVGVVADRQHTAVQFTARAEPPARRVSDVAGHRMGECLVLRDDQGRTYREQPCPRPPSSDRVDWDSGAYTGDALFPPLAPDARSVELVLPYVTVMEETPEAMLTVPIAGWQVGDRIPLDAEVTLGPYTFRVAGAEIVNERFRGREARRLVLHLVIPHPPSSPGQRNPTGPLIAAGPVPENGGYASYQVSPWRGAIHAVGVALPDDAGEEVTITFRDAMVTIEGPWRLTVPVR